MPFTISHVVAALPIKKLLPKKSYFDALIIGTMMPDFAYFLPFNFGRGDTHTLLSLFTFSVPVGFTLLYLFRYLLKKPLITITPLNLEIANLKSNLKITPNSVLLSILTILIGSITHILWDSFTHLTGFMVTLFPILLTDIIPNHIQLEIYKFLQHGSSIFGLVVIYLEVKKRGYKLRVKRDLLIITLIPVVISLIMFFFTLDNKTTTTLLWLMHWVIFTGGKIFLLCILIYSIFWNIRKRI